MPRALVGNLGWSYLLIRTVEVSHRCKPSIVDCIGEDGPNSHLAGLSYDAVREAYNALCQDVIPLETASLIFPRAD